LAVIFVSFSLFTIYLTWQRTLAGRLGWEGKRFLVVLTKQQHKGILLASSVNESGFSPAERNFVLTSEGKEKRPGKPVFSFRSLFLSLRLQPFSVPGTDQKVLTLRGAENGNKQVGSAD
jgi:hypothetical protein